MLSALKTRQPQFIMKALKNDWRMRYYTQQEAKLIVNELQDFTKSNDQGFVKIALEVLAKLIGFETNTTYDQQSLQTLIELYEQITQMLLLFVRSNESEKNIILDSVFLIRKIVQLFPEEQFLLIQRVTAQHERSITLLIAIMALVPYLQAFNLINQTSICNQITPFTQQVMSRLNVSDWLSPLTNGYLGFYDAGFPIQLLDTNKFFEQELNQYLKTMNAMYLPQFISEKQLVEEPITYITRSQVFKRIQKYSQQFNALLPQVRNLADQGNIEALQVLTAVSTVDSEQTQSTIQYLFNTLQKQMTPTYYESLFEIVAYYFQKCYLNDQISAQNSKNFIEFVKFFQGLLKNEQLNTCSVQTQIHIARVFGLLCKLRKYLLVSQVFLKELLIYLTQAVQTVLLSRDSPAFVKIFQQLKQNEGLCQIWAVQAWQPPPSPNKLIRVLLMQVLQSVQFLLSEKDIDVLELHEQIFMLLQEFRVCSNISVFRYLAAHCIGLLINRIPIQHTEPLMTLLKTAVQDPQWRNRLQLYQLLSSEPSRLLNNLIEDFQFPFLNLNQPGADWAVVLNDDRFEPSFYQQICDTVWQVRNGAYEFLRIVYEKSFLMQMGEWSTGGNIEFKSQLYTITGVENYVSINQQLMDRIINQLDANKITFKAFLQANKAKFIVENAEAVDGLALCPDLIKLEGYLQIMFSILSVLQFSEVKYLKESFLHISYFCLNCLQNFILLRDAQIPLSTDVGRRLHVQEKERAKEDFEKVIGCMKGVGW
ncbi:Conserved_hypothetical protein [Hexamita inflata]|uniref:Uncharacterized protein n=1 Tax=Hexamita inflata TaxID=28002 RepID=A0AA86RZ93_9EUKA|nr:Conserved hypothetical protein [Hexamita inflata]